MLVGGCIPLIPPLYPPLPRHFSTSAKVSKKHIGTSEEVSTQFGTETFRRCHGIN